MEKFNKIRTLKRNLKSASKSNKEISETNNEQSFDDSPKIPFLPFDNMKWIFEVKLNEVLLLFGLGGSIISLFYLFGYSKAIGFSIGLFINLQDYLNLSLYFSVPFFLFIGIVLLMSYVSMPLLLFINLRKFSKLTKKDLFDTIPVMIICYLFIAYLVTWLLPYQNLITKIPLININQQDIKFSEISFMGIKIKYLLLIFIIFILYTYITSWFFKMYLKNNIITFSKYILYSYIPLYLLGIVFIGYSHGRSEIELGKKQIYDIEIILKDDYKFQARLLYPFDKYLIVCDSTSQIKAIKTDDIRSLGTISKKYYNKSSNNKK